MIKMSITASTGTTITKMTLPQAFKVLSAHMESAKAGTCECTAYTKGYSFKYDNLPFSDFMVVTILEEDDA